jgi:hypothetical protein
VIPDASQTSYVGISLVGFHNCAATQIICAITMPLRHIGEAGKNRRLPLQGLWIHRHGLILFFCGTVHSIIHDMDSDFLKPVSVQRQNQSLFRAYPGFFDAGSF